VVHDYHKDRVALTILGGQLMSYQVKVDDKVKMTFDDEGQANDYAKTVAGVVVPMGQDAPKETENAQKLEQ
jgi:hypothetical protein